MKRLVFALVLAACGDNATPAPDASLLPSCMSLGCPPPTVSLECAARGVCTCDPDGRGPAVELACEVP